MFGKLRDLPGDDLRDNMRHKNITNLILNTSTTEKIHLRDELDNKTTTIEDLETKIGKIKEDLGKIKEEFGKTKKEFGERISNLAAYWHTY
jgi:archaellum component FlaC